MSTELKMECLRLAGGNIDRAKAGYEWVVALPAQQQSTTDGHASIAQSAQRPDLFWHDGDPDIYGDDPQKILEENDIEREVTKFRAAVSVPSIYAAYLDGHGEDGETWYFEGADHLTVSAALGEELRRRFDVEQAEREHNRQVDDAETSTEQSAPIQSFGGGDLGFSTDLQGPTGGHAGIEQQAYLSDMQRAPGYVDGVHTDEGRFNLECDERYVGGIDGFTSRREAWAAFETKKLDPNILTLRLLDVTSDRNIILALYQASSTAVWGNSPVVESAQPSAPQDERCDPARLIDGDGEPFTPPPHEETQYSAAQLEDIVSSLTATESDYLLSFCGHLPHFPWGAAMSAGMEYLAGRGLIAAETDAAPTDLGREVARFIIAARPSASGKTEAEPARNSLRTETQSPTPMDPHAPAPVFSLAHEETDA